MGKRIIISTSWASLNFLRGDREKKELNLLNNMDTSIPPKFLNLFIGYDHSTNNFVSNKSDSDIILIQDSAKKDELEQAGLKFNRSLDFFLHHTNANALLNDQNNLFQNVAQGLHEPNTHHKYRPVFDIILDKKEDKLNRILKELGFTDTQLYKKETLESKLNFLHHCLTPDGLKEEEVTKSEWAKLDEFTKLKSAGDGPFGDNYLSALRTLRDKLLAS